LRQPFDFGNANEAGGNEFRCNALTTPRTAPSPSYGNGYDFLFNASDNRTPSNVRLVQAQGNKWDHTPPTIETLLGPAVRGTDAVVADGNPNTPSFEFGTPSLSTLPCPLTRTP